jgi:ABC-type bacteriocin/lantibiotic exporter with double-glycine peptidase domain
LLDDLVAALPESRYRIAAGPHTGRLRGRIALVDVAAGYAPNRLPLLDSVNVRIEPGHRVVVLGAAGAGASTLLRLLVGAVEPLRGRVLLDGLPIAEIPRAVLRRSIGYVPQTPCLFPGTVADNVTLFDDAVPDDVVARALRDACLEDVIARRGGPRTAVVAPDGRNLSSGERQRLALARALVHDPSILVLDEPTSALDPALAARVDDVLRRRGVTTVIVTRDAGFVGPHDTVLVLEGGDLILRAPMVTPSAAAGTPAVTASSGDDPQGTRRADSEEVFR